MSVKLFVCDVDGCLTDGTFTWDRRGRKVAKRFGPCDAGALQDLQKRIPVVLVSADQVGWKISESRAKHMGIPLEFASDKIRAAEVFMIGKEHGVPLRHIAYMGDGRKDHVALQRVGHPFVPADAYSPLRFLRHVFVTEGGGGQRAVAEACDEIIRHRLA